MTREAVISQVKEKVELQRAWQALAGCSRGKSLFIGGEWCPRIVLVKWPQGLKAVDVKPLLVQAIMDSEIYDHVQVVGGIETTHRSWVGVFGGTLP